MPHREHPMCLHLLATECVNAGWEGGGSWGSFDAAEEPERGRRDGLVGDSGGKWEGVLLFAGSDWVFGQTEGGRPVRSVRSGLWFGGDRVVGRLSRGGG